ncbi:unnamed protein product, partial [Amoebophrya sp. A25]
LHLASIPEYLPNVIVKAFLSCIGVKVFYYAFKTMKYKWYQCLWSCVLGSSMWLLQHKGPAAVRNKPVLLGAILLALPTAVFQLYIAVFTDSSSNQLREQKWLLYQTKVSTSVQDQQFLDAHLDDVDWSAWKAQLADWIPMLVIGFFDNVFQISALQGHLP